MMLNMMVMKMTALDDDDGNCDEDEHNTSSDDDDDDDDDDGDEDKDKEKTLLLKVLNTFTSTGCTPPCGPYHRSPTVTSLTLSTSVWVLLSLPDRTLRD